MLPGKAKFKSMGPVDNDGMPMEAASPVLALMCQDITKLAELAHQQAFGALQRDQSSMVRLWQDEELHEAFGRADVRLLRLSCWGRPPPPVNPHDMGDDERFRCELVTGDGTVCGLEFDSKKGQAAHHRFATPWMALTYCAVLRDWSVCVVHANLLADASGNAM